jgi:LPPG:FO 2-phospho-L-lactate transferase
MMRNGMRLTNATKILCDRFGVRENVLPMTDTEVTTQVKTALGLIHFQEYWVRSKGQIEIEKVVRSFKNPPLATEEGMAIIEASEAVVIGPSNPITSISPILECEGIRHAIRDKMVITVSPFLGTTPFSGPAGALMQAAGFEPSSQGTLDCYEGISDIFVQDIRDPVHIDNSVRLDTLMTSEEKSVELANEILGLVRRG